ncbi:hypothetical protein D3C78_1261910 [compost metagenome]
MLKPSKRYHWTLSFQPQLCLLQTSGILARGVASGSHEGSAADTEHIAQLTRQCRTEYAVMLVDLRGVCCHDYGSAVLCEGTKSGSRHFIHHGMSRYDQNFVFLAHIAQCHNIAIQVGLHERIVSLQYLLRVIRFVIASVACHGLQAFVRVSDGDLRLGLSRESAILQ